MFSRRNVYDVDWGRVAGGGVGANAGEPIGFPPLPSPINKGAPDSSNNGFP
jgi:hypothetical protein